MNKKVIIVLMCIIAISCRPLQCKPFDMENRSDIFSNNESDDGEYNGNLDQKTIEQVRQCDKGLEIMELCMRCAKITKSTIVYPLCCSNEDKVRDWCHDYVYFGSK